MTNSHVISQREDVKSMQIHSACYSQEAQRYHLVVKFFFHIESANSYNVSAENLSCSEALEAEPHTHIGKKMS